MTAHVGGLNAESSGSSESFHQPCRRDLIGCVVPAESRPAAFVAVGDDDNIDCSSLHSATSATARSPRAPLAREKDKGKDGSN